MNKKMKKYITVFALLISIFTTNQLFPKEKIEKVVLDGSVRLVTFGIDTTRNWWAITSPFSGQIRVWINGEESDSYLDAQKLTFSPSGDKFAYFGKMNSGWNLVTSEGKTSINAFEIGDIKFSRINEKLSYSYIESNQEYLYYNDTKIILNKRFGEYFINHRGNKYAYVSKRGNSYVMNINGKESHLYDAIKPMGFMQNDKFMYAALNGNQWEVFSEEEALTEAYQNISEAVINQAGNTAAVIAQLANNYFITVTFNDEYVEPIYSGQYDELRDLVIHPSDALVACTGMLNHSYFVLLNSTEYFAEENCQAPKFSHNGDELFFLSCRLSCFLTVNGQKHKLPGFVSTNVNFAKKPGSMTISYASANSIVLQEIETGELYASVIIDRIADPIYNWKNNYYETVASIGDRLYLLGIRP